MLERLTAQRVCERQTHTNSDGLGVIITGNGPWKQSLSCNIISSIWSWHSALYTQLDADFLPQTQMHLTRGCTYRAWLSHQTATLYRRHPSTWKSSRAAETERGFGLSDFCFGTTSYPQLCELTNLLPGFQRRETWAQQHTAGHSICKEREKQPD